MQNKPVVIYENHDKLSEAAAHFFMMDCVRSIARRGRFTVALSGSETPQQFHHCLAQHPFSQNIPWHKVYFFWGDERHVPPEHQENNFRMAHDSLLQHIAIPADNIYPIPTLDLPKKDAKIYEKTLCKFFKKQPPRFDWIMLGLGTNGHTASLFPFADILKEKNRLIVPAINPDTDQPRITFTFPLINAARQIVFLVSGIKKAAMVKEAIEGNQSKRIIPVHGVRPAAGILTWMLDQDAASMLHSSKQGQKQKKSHPAQDDFS
jgi:6-phosphogluconolactonase